MDLAAHSSASEARNSSRVPAVAPASTLARASEAVAFTVRLSHKIWLRLRDHKHVTGLSAQTICERALEGYLGDRKQQDELTHVSDEERALLLSALSLLRSPDRKAGRILRAVLEEWRLTE